MIVSDCCVEFVSAEPKTLPGDGFKPLKRSECLIRGNALFMSHVMRTNMPHQSTPRKTPAQQKNNKGKEVIDFLKTVSTATRCLEFASDPQLNALPQDMAAHIEELEDLLSRLSFEAQALLYGPAIFPNGSIGGRR